MARARRTPSPPPVERSIEERSRPSASVTVADLEHLPHVYGYLRRRVADGATAERLTVAAFERVGTTARGGRTPRTELIRAAAAVLRDHIGEARLASGSRDALLDQAAMALLADALEPELQAAFNRLSAARQQVLTLHHLDHLTAAEAGAVLDLRPSAFQARLGVSIRALEHARIVTSAADASGAQVVDAA